MYRGSRPQRGGYHPAPPRGFGPRASAGPPPPERGYQPPAPRRRCSPGAREAAQGCRAPGREQRLYGRYSPSPPRSGGLPIDHSLVITVGNELTHPAGYKGTDAPYIRDYGAGDSHYNKPYYSPRRSSHDGHSDRGSRRRSVSRGRSRGRSRSPGYARSKSRQRSRSRSRSYSRGRSPERAKSRARSKSRTRGRTYSRSRSRSRSGSRSRKQSRARSRARSKSRPRSRSRSRERSRSRGRSRGRSCARSRSVSRSGSSTSSGSSRSRHSSVNRRVKSGSFRELEEDFTELEKARRRKEIQDMLVKPAKSILKKRMDSSETDSPMLVQNCDSPRGNPDSGLSHEAEQLLCALSKTMDPNVFASMLGKSSDGKVGNVLEELIGKLQPAREGESDPLLPHLKGRPEKSDLTELLGMIAQVAHPPNVKKSVTDIEDEEKFLYGDEEEEGDEVKPAKEVPDTSFPKSCDVQRREHGTAPYTFGQTAENVTSRSQRDSRHRSSVTPEVHAKDEPDDFLPGVGPQDVKVRREVEEYEKIQDLLKTIGLDLGVAEISKMAARTQERLHGNVTAKKTSASRLSDRKHRSRSRSYSSSSSRSSSCSRSSSRSRSRGSRSSSFSRTTRQSRKKQVSPEPRSPHSHSQSKKEAQSSVTESRWPTTPTVGPGTPTYPSQPSLPSHPVPPYPPPCGVMPPDFPPHGYDAYGNYVPYLPPGWPMYPPPGMPVPPPSTMDPYSLPNFERPYLKLIKTGASESKTDNKKAPSKLDAVASKVTGIQMKEMEDKNTASEKQKVMEELEKLKKEKIMRQKRKENLLKDVETLRKQQGEVLRKKRREKDGHKDPLLIELGQLQENAMAQISKLRAEQREADQKHEELVKVALILGIDYKDSKISGDHEQQPPQSKESTRSPEKSGAKTSTSYTKVCSSKSRASPEKPKSSPPLSSHALDAAAELFEYYDAGNHWCKNCNVTSGSMFDYFMHLHSKTHRKTLDPYDRPWAKSESEKKQAAGKRTSKPAKGSEFLIPVRGFFCQLCEEFFGDPICAEAHVTCHAHNERYKTKMYENPLYEQRRKLDRQAGLESQKSSDHKRKREDDDQDTKKAKHGKGGKMSSNEVETKPQYGKEEEYKNIKENENKFKEKYKEEDERFKMEEEERARYKKDDDERNRFKKEEEYTYRYRKEDGERFRYEEERFRNRDDDEYYRYREKDDRYRLRKEDDRGRYGKEEEKAKYSREEDKRYKHTRENEEKSSKFKDEDWGKWPKSKWDEDQESNGKHGKKEDKTLHPKGKAGYFRDDQESTGKFNAKEVKGEPEKPSEPPKVLCGPSPALLAKLRKKNEEATGRPGFGKFGRKKPQKTALEKEAERMAAQFLKEEEEAPAETEENKEAELDPFTKSIAAAKSIAMKLSGKVMLPPSCEWLAYNENKSNPNIPPPLSPMVIRKSFTGVQNKPTPSAGPLTGTQKGPALSADLISKAFSGEEVQLKHTKSSTSPVDLCNTSVPLVSPKAASQVVNPAQIKPVTRSECVMLKSDVAAPGVPEEEQRLTIVLRPPPLLPSNARGPSPKMVKPKTTLAAGKAKDLYDIFYSSSTAVKGSVSASVGGKQDSGFTDCDSSCKVSNNKGKNISDIAQSKESPMNKDSNVAQTEEPPKNEDSEVVRKVEPPKYVELGIAQSAEPPRNKDSEVALGEELFNRPLRVVQRNESPKNEDPEVAQSEESPRNEDSEIVQKVEPPKYVDLGVAQRAESPRNKDSEVALGEELLNRPLRVVQRNESPKNEDPEVAQSEESPRNEDSEIVQKVEPPKYVDLGVAQRAESPRNKDSEVALGEELLNKPLRVAQRNESPRNEDSEVAQSEESPKNVDSKFELAFEDVILKPDNSKVEDLDHQVLKSMEISLGDVTALEVTSVDTMQTNTEEENPLESEEPMSFSPLPGSFTEQLNLDTFEFSFEPL